MSIARTLGFVALGAGLSVASTLTIALGTELGLTRFYSQPTRPVRPYYELPIWRASSKGHANVL